MKYWTEGKLSEKILGVKKPSALTGPGWRDWEAQMRTERPFRYWLSENVLSFLEDAVYWIPNKINGVRYYIANRFVTKTHALTANKELILRGQWVDLSDRLLPCMFSELVEFVEVESAWRWCAWNEDEFKKYNAPNRNNRKWRCPEAGTASLEWASTLTIGQELDLDKSDKDYDKPTPQAKAAKEILTLYLWFKNEYLNRKDAYEFAGYNEVREHDMFDEDPDLQEQLKLVFDKVRVIELIREEEDTQMMCRLIKVRNNLWT